MQFPLKYVGSKAHMAPLIADMICSNQIYIEPFAGSFSCGFALLRSKIITEAVLSDSDFNVYNFWNCLKENALKLYTSILDLKNIHKDSSDNYEKAAYFWWQKHLGNGISANKNLEEMQPQMKGAVSLNLLNSFLYYSELLQHVTLFNRDYVDLLDLYNNKDAFWYLDPPYMKTNNIRFYNKDCENFSHEKLELVIGGIQGSFCLSYDSCDEVINLYKKYTNLELFRYSFRSRMIIPECMILKSNDMLDKISENKLKKFNANKL